VRLVGEREGVFEERKTRRETSEARKRKGRREVDAPKRLTLRFGRREW